MTVKYVVHVSTISYPVGTDRAILTLPAVPLEAVAEEDCLHGWDGSCGPGTVDA